MVEVPHLLEDSSVRAAAEIRDRARLRLQSRLDVAQGIGGFVRRQDA